MTKARTLADYVPFDSTGVLTSSSSLDATQLTGSLNAAQLTGDLPALNGSALTNVSGVTAQSVTAEITNGNANQTTSTFKSSTEAGGSGDVALTITPTATGSKLLVGIQCSMSSTTANKSGVVAIYRGTTKIAEKGILYQNIGSNINTGFYIECLDTPTIPATPVPITYTLKFACAQNNAQVNIHAESGDPARVTILEIAA